MADAAEEVDVQAEADVLHGDGHERLVAAVAVDDQEAAEAVVAHGDDDVFQ